MPEWELNPNMFLTLSEARTLLQRVLANVEATSSGKPAGILDAIIIESLLLSGMKTSEFCEIRVLDTVVGHGESAFRVTRNGEPHRTVYVPAGVSRRIEDFVSNTRRRFLPGGVDPWDLSKPLVYNEHRRPFERTGLYRRVVRILTDAGFGDRASVQLLRHTYGYLAYLQTGGNLLFVQSQLGHSHPRITSMYAKVVDESYPDLAERLDGVLDEPLGTIGASAMPRVFVPEFDCATD